MASWTAEGALEISYPSARPEDDQSREVRTFWQATEAGKTAAAALRPPPVPLEQFQARAVEKEVGPRVEVDSFGSLNRAEDEDAGVRNQDEEKQRNDGQGTAACEAINDQVRQMR